MIVKKLAVPLINDKILQQTEHCLVATAAITESAFDFIKNRLPPKCKLEIVIGMEALTSPAVLKRIWKHYLDRITLKVFTKNVFHGNVYIFDLPYRKSVAFLGSGHFTIGGIKDNEEIFYKLTDQKEIEALKSWFVGYYEFAEALTEDMILEYETIYPALKQREISSRHDKEQVIALTTRGFNWDAIRFKNQYFKKEDYLTFSNSKASLINPVVESERIAVQGKLEELGKMIGDHLAGLYFDNVSSINPADHPERKLRSLWISYGRNEKGLTSSSFTRRADDLMCLQVLVMQRDVGIWLQVGKPGGSQVVRENFRRQMEEHEYRKLFFVCVKELGAGYWIEVEGERKAIESFQGEDAMWEFTKMDDWRFFPFVIGKNFSPSSPEISVDSIAVTIKKEFDKLVKAYNYLWDTAHK